MQKKSVQTESPADDDAQVLTISPEKVCFVLIKAREYEQMPSHWLSAREWPAMHFSWSCPLQHGPYITIKSSGLLGCFFALCQKRWRVAKARHHRSPGHQVKGGSLADIFVVRSTTRWLRLYG